jgi:nucleoid DNA-binding protein
MEDLIKMITDKVGISEAQAKSAVDMVTGFLKDKLPAPIAAQIDTVLKSGGSSLKDLGGMFNK